jgi:hypothetical protein
VAGAADASGKAGSTVTVQQVLRKLGAWSIKLVADAPNGVLAQLDYFGHVAVIPGRLNPVERGDECLSLARYVGVLRDFSTTDEEPTMGGPGLAMWLGDENGKGDVIETPGVTVTGASFATAIRALLPSHEAITEGTIDTGVPGTITNTWMYTTPRAAIDYVCDTMGGTWRVTNTGTLDAGPASSLFRTTPSCIIARKDTAGYDMATKVLPGRIQSTRSVKEYTSRVVLVAQALAGGIAEASTIPYKDIHGNSVAITRVVDETDETTYANAPGRAQAVLSLYTGPTYTTRLDVAEFDIAGDIEPGDTVWVWDPQGGLVDESNEVVFRGRVLHPVAVQALSLTWPVTRGYTVAYRSNTGVWTDLSPWMNWESEGNGQVEIADVTATALTSSVGSSGTQVSGGGGGLGDVAVPDTPVFGAFSTSSYQPDDGLSRASVTLTWTEPVNTDGSSIVDGDHYEIRYRPTGTSDWESIAVPFSQTQATVTNLPPATGYDWQVRAADYATPRNYSEWSSTTEYSTAEDTTAPDTPAAPSVASSLIAVQVTHTLGLASGGTYNLPLDMDHFEVHVGTESSFVPDAESMAGKLPATGGMVTSGTPAVGTFPTDAFVDAGETAYVKVVAVDKTGNRSPASSYASATALLIDDAHISDLTVSKVTAGELSASVLLSGNIKTSASWPRVELNANGLLAYDSSGVETVNVSGVDGSVTVTGTLQTGVTGQRIVIDPSGLAPAIYFYPASGSNCAYMNNYSESLSICSATVESGGVNVFSQVLLYGSISTLIQRKEDFTQWGGKVTFTTTDATISTNRGDTHVESTYASGIVYIEAAKVYVGGQDSKTFTPNVVFNDVSSNYDTVGIELGTEQGRLCVISSSRRFKREIVPWEPRRIEDILALQPVTYYGAKEYEANRDTSEGLLPSIGLIAEDTIDIPNIGPLLAYRNGDGEVQGIHYDRGWVVLLPVLKEIYADIQRLKESKNAHG